MIEDGKSRESVDVHLGPEPACPPTSLCNVKHRVTATSNLRFSSIFCLLSSFQALRSAL
jgi:hypothetical protein